MPVSGLPVEVLAALPRRYLSQVSEVKVLSQGLSNSNYLLQTRALSNKALQTQAWVLRVNSRASSFLCNRAEEVANWRLAESGGLAPALLWVSDDHQYYLSEYIAQASPPWEALAAAVPAGGDGRSEPLRPDAAGQLLGLLQRLQALPLPANDMSVAGQWQAYRHKLQRLAVAAPTADWQARHRRLLALTPHLDAWLARLDACLLRHQYCHRDLNPHNLLLRNNQLVCIDFEYACASHPLFELAGVLASHGLSVAQRDWLTAHYLTGHPHLTPAAGAALASAIDIYWVFAACWALLLAGQEVDAKQRQAYLAWFDSFCYLVTK
ncbi:phosphotransferase [Shewanella salipaludis]|uniref:Phosphotransferase n=1 Tax=Shewanella salipaludis TaxID=2723052 RepID=A0A972FR91_9GAMM|nr:phosphotransferase [Shewanella salipaludis]NMH64272.1 phosphotransferase [Shewanella salipaludis]